MAASPLTLTGGTGANAIYLREDADHLHLDVWQNAAKAGVGTPTQSVLTSAVSTVTVTAGGMTDAVTLDFANGDPFAGAVAVDGLSTAATTLTVTGLNGTAVSVGATTVTVGAAVVSYGDVQGIAVVGSAANDTLTQTAQPLAPLTFAGGGGGDTLDVDAGTYTLAGDPAAATANLTVNDAGQLYFAAAAAGTGVNARHLASLTVPAGGSAVVDAPVTAADRAVLVVGSLSAATAGAVDLTGNDLVVTAGTPAAVSAAVTSSAAAADPRHLATLGVSADTPPGGSALFTTFDGVAVPAAAVLAKYTVYGDANLDGVVNGADYLRVDAGYVGRLAGWANGDFNGDGAVDGSDYTLVDNAFDVQAPADPLVTVLQGDLAVAAEQARKTIAAIGTSANYPQRVNADGTWAWVPAGDWTSGTWAGELWGLYQATGDPYFAAQATRFTTPLSVNDTQTGDVGPRVYDAFYPLVQHDPTDTAAVNVMLTAAASKAATFNATVGSYKSWYGGDVANSLATLGVLTDYIMDDELLYWASAQTGNPTDYNQAVSNEAVIEKYSVRADGSTAQFSFFNPSTGQFGQNETYQGYAANSTWSRGQAWAIYGFTQGYAATGRADFLSTAERTADWYLAHLPADDVPYWDFNDPAIPSAPRDTSAAAVAASGLLTLSKLIAVSDPTNSARYRTAAGQILASLSTPAYLNSPAGIGDGVLLHGASNVPAGISDNSLNYGDYFFVQAINEYLGN